MTILKTLSDARQAFRFLELERFPSYELPDTEIVRTPEGWALHLVGDRDTPDRWKEITEQDARLFRSDEYALAEFFRETNRQGSWDWECWL